MSDAGKWGLRRLDSTAVWSTETVPVQYLRVTDVDNARKIDKKLHCDLIRNLFGHIPIGGEYLELYIRLGVGNGRGSIDGNTLQEIFRLDKNVCSKRLD